MPAAPLVETIATNLHLASGRTPLHILRDINLRLESGEVAAVVGPSGSGKTSLLLLLAGLEQPSSGTITIDGQALAGLNEDELAIFRRRSVGILFQSFHLIPSMTALENVMLALEIAETGRPYAELRQQAALALEEVGLGERLQHLPNALSGGEQQRVGLARAMVTTPRLLLADEPTGNLDQETGARVIELMFGLARARGTTILLVTHDLALAARADRRLEMDRGRLTPAPAA